MRVLIVLAVTACAASPALAQWNPAQGLWGKTDERDLRVMTWNIQDTLCRTQPKVEGSNSWCALARIVAVVKPDILILQECGDNSGNGTGTGVDSVAQLQTVMTLFVSGGTDPFLGGSVSSWVGKYAPTVSLPHAVVSDVTDGFNRNVVLSRYPLADLTGDGRTFINQFVMFADLYATNGNSGIRGFQFVEIDLPDAHYRGDVVIGNGHLRSGGEASDLSERLTVAQRLAYYIDHMFNGAGTGVPDPNNKIVDSPAATRVLDPYTPVVWGGDLNEDENLNGRDGPALWTVRAASSASGDGTDRDRSDSVFDDARDPLNANATSNRRTQGSSKLDYLCWQDSIATLRRGFIFNSATAAGATVPFELIGFPTPSIASTVASDHRPVIVDLILPAPTPPPECPADFNGDGFLDFFDLDAYVECFEGLGCPDGKNADFNGDGFLDFFDLDAYVLAFEEGCP
ncbi:MAG: hypothetical protein HRU70_00905 [Phycisphaeraceae bacterium]|nr:MAG: hypothetical protein HRU70_00905 [Phycisphaeraceae bacterium]